MEISLEALRCPDATRMMRRAIDQFLKTDDNVLKLSTIEPSMERNIKAFIGMESLPVSFTSSTRPITEDDHRAWLEHFDEEDFEDVSTINTFTIQR
jgi:hypothetical protein